MRLISVAALVTLGAVSGCGSQTQPGGTPDALPEGRGFVSTEVTGHRLVPGTRVDVRFARGKLQASAGCNSVSGDARVSGGRLLLVSVTQTEMGCDPRLMDQDRWLIGFLTGEPDIRMTGDDLTLTKGGITLRMKDRKSMQSDKPLIGTRWNLDTIVAGDTASSVPSGVRVWIEFGSNGLAVGNAGCNEFGGDPEKGNYSVKGDTITFHEVASTQMSCGKERDALERTVLGVLHGTVTYRISDGALVVTHPSGTQLRFRPA